MQVEMKQISDRVFAKFDLEEKDVKYACEIIFKNDQ